MVLLQAQIGEVKVQIFNQSDIIVPVTVRTFVEFKLRQSSSRVVTISAADQQQFDSCVDDF